MNKYSKQRRTMALLILLISYVSFFSYVMAESFFKFNTATLYRCLTIPLDISKIVLPIWSLAWLYYAIRSISLKAIITRLINDARSYQAYSFKMLGFLSMIIMLVFMFYQLNNYTTSGCFMVEAKYEEGDLCYIVVNDTKIKCDQKTFESVVEGSGYALTYVSNVYTASEGRLKEFDINN